MNIASARKRKSLPCRPHVGNFTLIHQARGSNLVMFEFFFLHLCSQTSSFAMIGASSVSKYIRHRKKSSTTDSFRCTIYQLNHIKRLTTSRFKQRKNINRQLRIFCFCLVLLSVINTLLFTDASPPYPNNLHWGRKTNPFSLSIYNSLTSSWNDELLSRLHLWVNTPSVIFGFKLVPSDRSSAARLECLPLQGRVRICDHDEYGPTDWVAKSQTRVTSGNLIISATIRINTGSSYWNNMSPKKRQRARNQVLCHELGHVLGLDHPSTDGSSQNTCLDYSRSFSSQDPADHDYTALEYLYSKMDRKNTYRGSGDVGYKILHNETKVSQRASNGEDDEEFRFFHEEINPKNLTEDEFLISFQDKGILKESTDLDEGVDMQNMFVCEASDGERETETILAENEYSVTHITDCTREHNTNSMQDFILVEYLYPSGRPGLISRFFSLRG